MVTSWAIFQQNMGNRALGPPPHDPHMNGTEIIRIDVHHMLAITARTLRELPVRIHKVH